MIRGLDQVAQALDMEVRSTNSDNQDNNSEGEIPMMYRAQVKGRCALQFAGNNADLEKWSQEWIYPKKDGTPIYQHNVPPLGLQGNIFRIRVEFPFRLFSNSGQDSIFRPIMGKKGIPFFSGSSIKGLFRRVLKNDQARLRKYCGDDNNLSPSTIGFRFHGAYPIGDWSGMKKVNIFKHGRNYEERRYRIIDVVHPQQKRQIGEPGGSASAFALISLYKPSMIFEFSSRDPVEWDEVSELLNQALTMGVGGKTSTGYGLSASLLDRPRIIPKSNVNVILCGEGVSPTLRTEEPEFRPNLFKATLRSHVMRLLGGVQKDATKIKAEVDRLFGSSTAPGKANLYWQETKPINYGDYGRTKTYEVEGMLHIYTSKDEDLYFLELVLKFAFIMGGFGKSWRRASHKLFYPTYKKFEIGCHWKLHPSDTNWLKIHSPEALKQFLDQLYEYCGKHFGSEPIGYQSWREAWHPSRLTIYGQVINTTNSKAIHLFHDVIFKNTPAIGGKNVNDGRPRFTSHIWHRMLPIGDNQSLELITIFHGNRTEWNHEKEGEQLLAFIEKIKSVGMRYIWGQENIVKNGVKPSKAQNSNKPKPIKK